METLKALKRLLKTWEEAPREALYRSLPDKTMQIAAGLMLHATSFASTAVGALNRGEVPSASVMSRTLFETLLAIRFILDETMTVRFADRRVYPPNETDQGVSAPRGVRASCYAFHTLELMRKVSNRESVKRLTGRAAGMIGDKKRLEAIENVIGEKWTNAVRHTNRFCGCDSKSLAEILAVTDGDRALAERHEQLFGIESCYAHGAAALLSYSVDREDELLLMETAGTFEIESIAGLVFTMFYEIVSAVLKAANANPDIVREFAWAAHQWAEISERYANRAKIRSQEVDDDNL